MVLPRSRHHAVRSGGCAVALYIAINIFLPEVNVLRLILDLVLIKIVADTVVYGYRIIVTANGMGLSILAVTNDMIREFMMTNDWKVAHITSGTTHRQNPSSEKTRCGIRVSIDSSWWSYARMFTNMCRDCPTCFQEESDDKDTANQEKPRS